MKAKLLGIRVYVWGIVLSVVVLAIVIGSFCDFGISQKIMHVSRFNSFMAGKYIFIANVVLILAGAAAFKALKKLGHQTIGIIILALLFYRLFSKSYNNFTAYIGFGNIIIRTAISALLVACFYVGVFFLGVKHFDDSDPKYLLYLSVLVFAGYYASTQINGVLKNLTRRPRYNFIVSDSNIEGYTFVPWWNWSFSRGRGYGSEFLSFPSGHMCVTSVFMTLPLFNKCLKKPLKNGETMFFAIAIAINLYMGYNRIAMGAHFLTDVAFGFAIATTVYCFLSFLINRKMS